MVTSYHVCVPMSTPFFKKVLPIDKKSPLRYTLGIVFTRVHGFSKSFGGEKMEKEIRISMRIDKELKQAFFSLCAERDQTPSKVIKRLMQEYIERNSIKKDKK